MQLLRDKRQICHKYGNAACTGKTQGLQRQHICGKQCINMANISWKKCNVEHLPAEGFLKGSDFVGPASWELHKHKKNYSNVDKIGNWDANRHMCMEAAKRGSAFKKKSGQLHCSCTF